MTLSAAMAESARGLGCGGMLCRYCWRRTLVRMAKTGVVVLALAALGAGGLLVRHPLLREASRAAAEQELARLLGAKPGAR
jgi:hypothetical protein